MTIGEELKAFGFTPGEVKIGKKVIIKNYLARQRARKNYLQGGRNAKIVSPQGGITKKIRPSPLSSQSCKKDKVSSPKSGAEGAQN